MKQALLLFFNYRDVFTERGGIESFVLGTVLAFVGGGPYIGHKHFYSKPFTSITELFMNYEFQISSALNINKLLFVTVNINYCQASQDCLSIYGCTVSHRVKYKGISLFKVPSGSGEFETRVKSCLFVSVILRKIVIMGMVTNAQSSSSKTGVRYHPMIIRYCLGLAGDLVAMLR